MLFLLVVMLLVALIVGYPWIVAAGASDRQQEAEHLDAIRSGAHTPLHLVEDEIAARQPDDSAKPRSDNAEDSPDDMREVRNSRPG